MLGNNVIAKRVMAVIKTKIADAQKLLDLDIATLDEEHAVATEKIISRHHTEIYNHEHAHAETKEATIQRHVESVIGKVL